MNNYIKYVTGREILDSRGNPTLKAEVYLENGLKGEFSVPSGKSVGAFEAVELRDQDQARYSGQGVLTAVENVKNIISPALAGKDPQNQQEIDNRLIELDGSKNKSKLGANSILGVSVAVAKAAAAASERKLYNYLNSLISSYTHANVPIELKMPVPFFNILNGGAHSDNNLSIQEFIITPKGIDRYSEQLRAGSEINFKLKEILKQRGAQTSVGDEGGFAPNLPDDESAIDFILEAIEKSGYKSGAEVFLALDIAASQYYEKDDKVYAIPHVEGQKVLVDKPDKITDFYMNLMKKYPIIGIEDPLSEDDWEGWKKLSKKMNLKETMLIGDDFTVTDPVRVEKAAKEKIISGLIIKPNQIGTLSEVIRVIEICDKYGIKKILSHRSGETTDTFIADLSVACAADFLKDGAPVRGERVAKYNRLLEIEDELNIETY